VRAEGVSAGGGSQALPSLVEQLSAAALHEDTRLVPAGELAVRLLAPLPADEASRALIEICSNGDVARRIRDTACELLGTRTDGIDAVLVALAKHADYLQDEHAPPLAPLARAAATAADRRAAPLLLGHLEDPATNAEDLPVLVNALATIGDASVVPGVARFLRMYHADVSDGSLSDALVFSTQLISRLSPDSAGSTLEPIASDSLGDNTVREAARTELAKLPTSASSDGEHTSQASAEPTAETATPARLSAEDLSRALTSVRAEVTECVRNDSAHPASGRLTVVVEPDGSVHSVRTLPESLLACVGPVVRRLKLPAASFGKRETLHHTITR